MADRISTAVADLVTRLGAKIDGAKAAAVAEDYTLCRKRLQRADSIAAALVSVESEVGSADPADPQA